MDMEHIKLTNGFPQCRIFSYNFISTPLTIFNIDPIGGVQFRGLVTNVGVGYSVFGGSVDMARKY